MNNKKIFNLRLFAIDFNVRNQIDNNIQENEGFVYFNTFENNACESDG